MRPAGGDDDGPDPVVVGQLGHRPRQVGPERRTEGVPGGRPVEPEGRDVAVDVDREHVGREAVAHAPGRLPAGPGKGSAVCQRPVAVRSARSRPETGEVQSCTRSPPTALPACPDPTGCVVAGRRRSRTSRRCRSRPRRKRSGATRRSTSSTSTSTGRPSRRPTTGSTTCWRRRSSMASSPTCRSGPRWSSSTMAGRWRSTGASYPSRSSWPTWRPDRTGWADRPVREARARPARRSAGSCPAATPSSG